MLDVWRCDLMEESWKGKRERKKEEEAGELGFRLSANDGSQQLTMPTHNLLSNETSCQKLTVLMMAKLFFESTVVCVKIGRFV